MASAPKQALTMGSPSPPFPISIHLPSKPYLKWPGSQGEDLAQGRDKPQLDGIAHSLFLLISTDKLGHLVPLSTSELGVRET